MVAHFRTCDSQSYGLASPRGVSSCSTFLDGLNERQHSEEAKQSEDYDVKDVKVLKQSGSKRFIGLLRRDSRRTITSWRGRLCRGRG